MDCTGSHPMTITEPTATNGYQVDFGPAVATPIAPFSPTAYGGGVHAVLNIPLDYKISFTITPTGIQEQWSNIFHITATGQNCCNYGDRIPGVWFFPGNTRLHVVHGHADSGNDDCSPEEPLPLNVATPVDIEIRQKHVEVRFNGRIVCTEPRGTVETFNAAHMYISDTWHPAANAAVSEMKLEHMTPKLGCTHHASCNYDPTAAFDDDSCVQLTPGMECGCPPPPLYPPPPPSPYYSPPALVCNRQTIGPATGPFQFLPTTMAPIRERAVHAMVNLPLDYTISFNLQPNSFGARNEAWSNIIHFTATGNNCCEYGDRVPAVWFYPGSLQLHIIDGQPSDGNDECEIPEELREGQTYHIEIKVSERGVDVSFDGQHKCHEAKSDRQALQNVRLMPSS
jgi:uncharacterized protein (DUF427 family)